MPLVGFRPTKARLVMENGKESVLVMKVVLDDDDAVELSTGGSLADLAGVLRIRERRAKRTAERRPGDRLCRLRRQSGRNAQLASAKFQVNVTMAADKFATLLRVANAGRLPTKFFVDAGERKGPEAKALGYRHAPGRAREDLGQPRVPHPARHELRHDPADRPAACDDRRQRPPVDAGPRRPRPRPTRKCRS